MAYRGRRHSEIPDPLRIEVFGENYCSQNSVKVSKINDSTTFEVLENNVLNRNIMWFMIEDWNGVHRRRILRNHNRDHIVTLIKKIKSLHNRWEAFNEQEKVPFFSAKQSGKYTKKELFLDVSLESIGKKLKVTGTYSEGTFKVEDVNELYFRIAEMQEGMVIVNPKVDYALVVALIMIQDALA